ncbi:MAG: PD-(D/E)XK nuclease family protein [Terracidiphilus sp.]|jgi:probable DNA repair protein
MGTGTRSEIDAWLRGGGAVVTASERGARAIAESYHRARQAEGLTAWPAPDVKDWHSFVREAWEERNRDARMVLNPLQEQALWAGIVQERHSEAASFPGTLHRLAAMAMEAHRLICFYAQQFLNARVRGTWQQDAAAFSEWLAVFDELCRRRECVSGARLALELAEALTDDAAKRKELLLAGFDRILPAQAAVVRAWGPWREVGLGEPASETAFFEAADTREELAACALWSRGELTANPKARLLIVTQNEPGQRGEIERTLLRYAVPEGWSGTNAPLFEFSLGVPLAQTALGRGALLTLKWLSQTLTENEIDWLISTGQIAADKDETRLLTAFMRGLRRRNLQRTEWNLTDWMTQRGADSIPEAWMRRITQARRDLEKGTRQSRSSVVWAELANELLETAGWPGGRPLGSEEHQVTDRLRRVLDDCASLGFDGERMHWHGIIDSLERAAVQALYAPQSQYAPILIAGPAETAGIEVDGIWFLGASEDAWPAAGTTHPFLPIGLQREAKMPHAAAQFDWELAQTMTARLLASARQVNFSYARQSDAVEARPSRVITTIAGEPQKLREELKLTKAKEAATEEWIDESTVPFPGGKVRGGAGVLTAQSQCPFKAFATARLGAESWDAAEAGLTAAQRGKLLHAVLNLAWNVNDGGVGSHADLMAIADLRAFVEQRVQRAMAEELRNGECDVMPPRYLELEHVRLTNLVTDWLQYERTRVEFMVLGTEIKKERLIEGLDLHLRMDRVDRLQDGKLLVIDYKTGDVAPKMWELPRPDDVQLPLYAGFGLDENTECGGLVFAKIRAGELEFVGRVENVKSTLLPDVSARSGLAKNKLTEQDMAAWREYIEQMARDFVAGEAKVDPRDGEKTCEKCGLQTLCRIAEFETASDDEEGAGEDNGDE